MIDAINDLSAIDTWIDDCYKKCDLLDFNSLMNIGVGGHLNWAR
jgi:hypothetical protein